MQMEAAPPDPGARPKAITLRLVMERSLLPEELIEYNKLSEDEALARAQALKTLPLEWQNIGEIGSLDIFEATEVLYMQYNRIERIENLECLPRLQFLALQGNRISVVENLQQLCVLEFLDLSKNEIQRLDEQELPLSINMLNLRENPCTKAFDYSERVLRRLTGLLVLDGAQLQHLRGAAAPAAPGAAKEVEEPADSAPFSSSQGLSAFHDRRAMQAESATSIASQIQAFTAEALADVEGFPERMEGALDRSKARREAVPEPRPRE